MNKLTVAVFAVLLAVLGGCATNSGGDPIGTGAVNYHDATGPFFRGVDNEAGG